VAWKVIIGRVALRDLHRIGDFIARDDPTAAVSFCQKLLDRAEALREFPERGGHLSERPGARFSVVGSYLIVYRVDQVAEAVRILRFWHGARERRQMWRPTS
jgi:plasmid stabilization system protein ParE